MGKRKKLLIIVFATIVTIFIYYIYELYATNGIMDMAREVAEGEAVVERGTPYAIFTPVKGNTACNIKRCFVYCGINEGKILLTWVRAAEYDGKVYKNRDWCELLIEKGSDGRWVAVGNTWKP